MLLKSVFAAVSLVALASVVGCAEPQTFEDKGESASEQVAYPKTSHDRILDALEEKANNCDVFTEAETRTLESYQNHVDWTFEAYVSFTCSYEAGALVVASYSMEKRAGWSSSDGVFTEEAMETTASIDIPLKVVELSGAVTESVSIRQAKGTVVRNRSASVSGSVSKNLGVVKGTASVAFDGKAVTVSGSGSAPLPISSADCRGGNEKVGVTVSLTAESVLDNHGLSDAAANALKARAAKIRTRGHQNFLATSAPGESAATKKKLHDACCEGWGTCS